MDQIANPNIQISFEYLADTVIASMSHKQLWVCLNKSCMEHGLGRNWTPDPSWDRGEFYLCECGSRRTFCKYNEEEEIPIKGLRDDMKKLLLKELDRYSDTYKRLYDVDVTLRQEHISTIWNKVFCMTDTDFTLELIGEKSAKKEENRFTDI